ncbi:hypothetical protein DMO52_20765 [Salmonella enterica subsp. enterica serovar Amager]|nr:hypothetical protein [Salmonella enterica subsp. enterica serovar Amager]EBV5219002.1 hypothetical protein [Salmonella enterica subsp. enterica serovar Amager]
MWPWNFHRNKRQYGSQLTFIIRVMVSNKRSIIAIQPNLYEEIIQSVSIKKIGVVSPLKKIGVTRHLQVLFCSTSRYLFVPADS